QARAVPLQQMLAGSGKIARIHVDRRYQRLHRIGKNRCAPEAAAFHLPFTEVEAFAEFKVPGDGRQGFTFDQLGAQATQVTFARLREALEQCLGNDGVEQRVTEKFQSLVVQGAAAAVGQRQVEELFVAEGVAKFFQQALTGGCIHSKDGFIQGAAPSCGLQQSSGRVLSKWFVKRMTTSTL